MRPPSVKKKPQPQLHTIKGTIQMLNQVKISIEQDYVYLNKEIVHQ